MSDHQEFEELVLDEAQVEAKPGRFRRLRNYFLTGLIICAPLAITAFLIRWFIQSIDGWVKPLIPVKYIPEDLLPYLPVSIPGFGLVMAFFIVTFVGFLTANYVGRTIWGFGENLIARTPFIRSIYSGLKQIFETALSSKGDTFQKVALIEYPRKGIWAIVFISTPAKEEVKAKLEAKGKDLMSVFLPTTPNPTSGFLLFVPKSEVIELAMSVEEAAKLVISAGLVAPEYQANVKAAAKKEGVSLKGKSKKPAAKKPAAKKPASKKPAAKK